MGKPIIKVITLNSPRILVDKDSCQLTPLTHAVFCFLVLNQGKSTSSELQNKFWEGKYSRSNLSNVKREIQQTIAKDIFKKSPQGITEINIEKYFIATDIHELFEALNSKDFQAVERINQTPFLVTFENKASREAKDWLEEIRNKINLALWKTYLGACSIDDIEKGCRLLEQAHRFSSVRILNSGLDDGFTEGLIEENKEASVLGIFHADFLRLCALLSIYTKEKYSKLPKNLTELITHLKKEISEELSDQIESKEFWLEVHKNKSDLLKIPISVHVNEFNFTQGINQTNQDHRDQRDAPLRPQGVDTSAITHITIKEGRGIQIGSGNRQINQNIIIDNGGKSNGKESIK
jgi:predicted transcriptional regulator